jgi:hypothetical protein
MRPLLAAKTICWQASAYDPPLLRQQWENPARSRPDRTAGALPRRGEEKTPMARASGQERFNPSSSMVVSGLICEAENMKIFFRNNLKNFSGG